jgi:hypothetical protein
MEPISLLSVSQRQNVGRGAPQSLSISRDEDHGGVLGTFVHQACRLSHDVVICFSPQDTYHASISSTPILTKCRSFHTFVSSINPPHRLEEALQCHSPLGPSHGELEQHYVSTLSIYDHIVLDTTSNSPSGMPLSRACLSQSHF